MLNTRVGNYKRPSFTCLFVENPRCQSSFCRVWISKFPDF